MGESDHGGVGQGEVGQDGVSPSRVVADLPDSVRIPPELNGPARSANGGVAAGTMARLVTGPAEVRLSSPSPLGTDLPLRRDSEWAVAADTDGMEVMRVRPAEPPAVEVPDVEPGAIGDGFPFPDHPAHTCVICGQDHPDSLRMFPAPVPGHTGVMGTWWTPPDWAIDDAGHLRTDLLWGVLDCPGALAVMQEEDEQVFAALAGITGEVLAPVRAGERVLVLGFTLGSDGRHASHGSDGSDGDRGRKRHTGTAVLGEDGELRAHTRQLCILVPPSWAGD